LQGHFSPRLRETGYELLSRRSKPLLPSVEQRLRSSDVHASEGKTTEDDYEDKIKEAFRAFGITVDD
jgi:hypothetical protein